MPIPDQATLVRLVDLIVKNCPDDGMLAFHEIKVKLNHEDLDAYNRERVWINQALQNERFVTIHEHGYELTIDGAHKKKELIEFEALPVYSDVDKKAIVEFIKSHVLINGYCSTFWGIRNGVKKKFEDRYKQQWPYIKSVSALVVKDERFIRTVNQQGDDFDIIENPNYELNKALKDSSAATTKLYGKTENYYLIQAYFAGGIVLLTMGNLWFSYLTYKNSRTSKEQKVYKVQIMPRNILGDQSQLVPIEDKKNSAAKK